MMPLRTEEARAPSRVYAEVARHGRLSRKEAGVNSCKSSQRAVVCGLFSTRVASCEVGTLSKVLRTLIKYSVL